MKARARTHLFEDWRSARRSAVPRCVLLPILVVVFLQILAPSAYALDFIDVPTDHAYAVAISDLASRGVISGLPDGSFRPDEPVNRQQFAKMIVKTLGIPVSAANTIPFIDVPTDLDLADPLYPDMYVAVCYELGLTEAKTPIAFAPYEEINHQQLVSMIARAADLADPPAAYTPPFAAGQFYSSEYYLNARKASFAGLLSGLRNMGPSFDFLRTASRGECAQVLYNLLLLTQLPKDETAFNPSEDPLMASEQQQLADDPPTAVAAVTAPDLAKAGRTLQRPYVIAGACVAILAVSVALFIVVRRTRLPTKQSLDSSVSKESTNEQAQAILEKWEQEKAIASSLSKNPAEHTADDPPPLGLPIAPTSISIASEFDRLLERVDRS